MKIDLYEDYEVKRNNGGTFTIIPDMLFFNRDDKNLSVELFSGIVQSGQCFKIHTDNARAGDIAWVNTNEPEIQITKV